MNRHHPARTASVYSGGTRTWALKAHLHAMYRRGEIMRRSLRRVMESMRAFGIEVQPLLDQADKPCRLEQAYPWLKSSWKSA